MDLLNWLTLRQVAERLNYSQTHVWRLVKAQTLHGVQTPTGAYLVDPASVEEYKRNHPERYGPPQTPPLPSASYDQMGRGRSVSRIA